MERKATKLFKGLVIHIIPTGLLFCLYLLLYLYILRLSRMLNWFKEVFSGIQFFRICFCGLAIPWDLCRLGNNYIICLWWKISWILRIVTTYWKSFVLFILQLFISPISEWSTWNNSRINLHFFMLFSLKLVGWAITLIKSSIHKHPEIMLYISINNTSKYFDKWVMY